MVPVLPFTFDFHPYDVSRDGTRIAGQNETGEQRIGIGNLLTGETTYVSTAPLVPYEVFWAPGGDRIGFTGRLNDNATSDIYTIRPDGSGQTKLTDDAAYEGDLRWSPDGRPAKQCCGSGSSARSPRARFRWSSIRLTTRVIS